MSFDSKRVRNPENDIASVGMERYPAPADLKAVRAGIGAALQALYRDILGEKLAGRIAELVQELDQQRDQQKDTDGTEHP